MVSDRAIDSVTVLASVSYALSERDSEITRLRRRSDKQYADRRLLLWLHAEAIWKLEAAWRDLDGWEQLADDQAGETVVQANEKLRAELAKANRRVAVHEQIRCHVEDVLDGAIGTEVGNGAGEGLVGDVALLARQRDEARAELDAVKAKTRTALHFALSCCNQYTGECDDGGRSVADLMRQEGIEQPDTGATEQPPKTLADKFVDAAVAEVNRINSTTAREPRVWRKGDPDPPADVLAVRHTDSQRFTRYPQADLWRAGPAGAALTWRELTGMVGEYTLTEVIVDGES